MAESADFPPSAPARSDRGGEKPGGLPLTAGPGLGDDVPLTSEPPLAVAPALTSEPPASSETALTSEPPAAEGPGPAEPET